VLKLKVPVLSAKTKSACFFSSWFESLEWNARLHLTERQYYPNTVVSLLVKYQHVVQILFAMMWGISFMEVSGTFPEEPAYMVSDPFWCLDRVFSLMAMFKLSSLRE
jgi:hypothetical protein